MNERAQDATSAGLSVDPDTCFSDEAEEHYVFFHTIVFDEKEWPVEPSATERII